MLQFFPPIKRNVLLAARVLQAGYYPPDVNESANDSDRSPLRPKHDQNHWLVPDQSACFPSRKERLLSSVDGDQNKSNVEARSADPLRRMSERCIAAPDLGLVGEPEWNFVGTFVGMRLTFK